MTYLNELMPGVLGQLQTQSRKRRYREDVGLWANDVLGLQLWSKQREIGASIVANRNTAVAAGHGVGKTYVAGIIALWWIDTHPLGESHTFVASTAPSKDQVDLLWGVIRQMHGTMKQRFNEGLIDHGPPGEILGDNKWKLSDGQVIGQGRKPPDNKSDVAFQGRHATYLLAIGDEAVGLDPKLLDGLSNIATGKHNRILLLANPTDPSSAMAKIWPDSEGRGGNPSWNRIHISMMDSPLITGEDGFDISKAEGLSGWEAVEAARLRYGGKDDPRYIARVLGQWAWDSGLGLFPEHVISFGVRTVVVPDATGDRLRFGVDVSRAGVDSTQVYECREGDVWETDPDTGEVTQPTGKRGLRIRHVADWMRAPVTSSNPDNLGTAQRLNTLAKEYRANVINIDAGGGLGVGVFDAIHELEDQGDFYMYEVFGNDRKGVDTRAYINLRAYMFSELKKRMAVGEIDIDFEDEKLLDELRGIRFKLVNGSTLQIESKEDMRKRGAKSPDRADAVWYSLVDPLFDVDTLKAGDTLVADVEEIVGAASSWYDRGSNGISTFGW
jgi:hypothetical protein